jgi:hypothetical protein
MIAMIAETVTGTETVIEIASADVHDLQTTEAIAEEKVMQMHTRQVAITETESARIATRDVTDAESETGTGTVDRVETLDVTMTIDSIGEIATTSTIVDVGEETGETMAFRGTRVVARHHRLPRRRSLHPT